MRFRAIIFAIAMLFCAAHFTLAEDAQKAPMPGSTEPDTQKASAPDMTASTDSGAPAVSQDTNAPPAETPQAALTSDTPKKGKNVKPRRTMLTRSATVESVGKD